MFFGIIVSALLGIVGFFVQLAIALVYIKVRNGDL